MSVTFYADKVYVPPAWATEVRDDTRAKLLVEDPLLQGAYSMGGIKVEAGNLAANSVTAAAIAPDSITTSELAADAVEAANIKNGEVSNAKLASGIDASKVTTGTLPVAQVPSLPASQTTSGTFDVARIPTGIPVANLDSVTAVAADLNKTTVAAWAGGATANAQQSAEADIGTPATATAEDCANKINAVLAKLRTAAILST